MPDKKGVWKGLDVDTAKAIAVAVFGDASKIKYIALTAVQRLPALQSKEIDVLCRNTTQTLTRETVNGLNFCHVNFYDGQGFLVPKKLAGRCDVITSDSSQLAAIRSIAPNPKDYVLLPEIISKEPLAPVVRHGDDQWYDIVNWTVMALIQAEELGITSKNVDEMLKSSDPRVKRFLGVTPGLGKDLGLNNKWAYNIIKQVGNYGEIFERNVGVNTPLGLKRGLNALWTKGGLMYAAPFR